MSIQNDMFNYVMRTPENTNPAVLKSMINKTVQLVPFNLKTIDEPTILQDDTSSGAFVQFYDGNIVICNDPLKAKYVIPKYNIISSASGDKVTYNFSFYIPEPREGSFLVVVNGERIENINHKYEYVYADATYPVQFDVFVEYINEI